MNEAGEVGRQTFLTMPLWSIVVFYVLAVFSLAVFYIGVVQMIKRYRRGRTDDRAKPEVGRILKAFIKTFGSLTVFRHDLYAGIAHLLSFWGFVVLYIGTMIVLVDQDIVRPINSRWLFWKGDFYLWFSLAMDVFGIGLIVGLVMMAVRRRFFGLAQFDASRPYPRHADLPVSGYGWSDWAFLGILMVLVLSGFLSEGVRLIFARPDYEVWSPAGWWLADRLQGLGVGTQGAESLYPVFWWIHSLAGLGFVALWPYTKAVHLFLSFFSLALRDESKARRLPRVTPENGSGYRKITDLSWSELLGVDACVRCGRCHEACPAMNSGMPLSPRDLILDLRDLCRQSFKRGFRGPRLPADGNGNALAGGIIPGETLWSCTACLSCMDRCPVGVQHLPIIVQMRRAMVDEGAVDSRLQQVLMNLTRVGNSFGQSDRMRARWTRELSFKPTDARKTPVEYLWFLGDYASYDPRVQDISRTVASLFNHAGLDFGILYEGERNAGNDVRRVGEEGLFELLAEKNIATLEKCTFKHIVTTDPHTYNALKNEYADMGAEYSVMHYSELLLQLLQEGRLVVKNGGSNGRVTYHDPCYLGRYNGIYDAPRQVLQILGHDLMEMPRNRDNGYCCGAGGGCIWMEDTPGITERPSESRIREAVALDGVSTFAVACPKDLAMYQDAVKTTGNEKNIAVKDLSELVWAAVKPQEEAVPFQNKEG